MTLPDFLALAGRAGVDVLSLIALVGLLYRRRVTAPEMTLVFTALNIGLFVAISVIGEGDFKTGVGFGLFGLLSLVRLRSAAFTLRDIAYTFAALVLALVTGLPGRDVPSVVVLDLLVLVALWLVDGAAQHRPTRSVRLTLERVVTDTAELRRELVARLGTAPLSVAIDEVDWVRETTSVRARVYVDDPAMTSVEDPADDAPLEDEPGTEAADARR
jgi:hypothetical protein